MVAAFMKSVECFKTLVLLSFNKNLRDSRGRSVAHFAAAGGCFDILREADNLGGDWLQKDKDGRVPARFAALFGRLDVLQWFWIRGQLGDLEPTRDRWGDWRDCGLLEDAAAGGHTLVLEFLVNEVGCKFATPPGDEGMLSGALRSASAGGHDEALLALLRLGARAQLDAPGVFAPPLVGAVESGSFACVKVLVEAGARQKEGALSAASQAAKSGFVDILRYCLDHLPSDPDEALSLATIHGRSDCVKLLESRGAKFAWSEAALESLDTLSRGGRKWEYIDELLSGPAIPPLDRLPPFWASYEGVVARVLDRDLRRGTMTREVAKALGRVVGEGGCLVEELKPLYHKCGSLITGE
jgi:hypothetical protein